MILFLIVVFCAIFLNTDLGRSLGLNMITTISFMPFMVLIGKDLFLKKIRFKVSYNTTEYKLIVVSIIFIAFKFFLGENYFKELLLFIILPMLISMYLDLVGKAKLKLLKNVVDLFFVLECLVAVYERITKSFLFYIPNARSEIILATSEDWSFRSQAFLGHPLANAMVVSVIMMFVVLSNSKVQKKIIFLTLGFLALLAFNARGATMISSVFILPYFFAQEYKGLKAKYRVGFVLILVSFMSYILYSILNSSLGGRLVHSEKFIDSSAQTRLDVYGFYKYLSMEDLLLGNLDSYLYLTLKLGAAGVENGVIVLIIKYGLVFAVLLLILLFRYQKHKLRVYNRFTRNLILLVFYLIGIMNPNLATSVQWIFFIFIFYAYKDNISVKNKYIN